jgi:hypothetical protein
MASTSKKTVRDLKSAPERTQLYIRLLTRKGGATAYELRDAAGAYTCHNSWSLCRFAEAYGFVCFYGKTDDSDYVVYQFVKPGQQPTAWATKPANVNTVAAKKAAAASIKADRKVAKAPKA